MINYLGFVYYSHDSEFYNPLVQGPNPRYGSMKVSKEQLNMLMNLMILNNENPFDNTLMNFQIDDLYVNKTIR